MEIGAKEPDTELNNVLKGIAVNECCTLVYTVSNFDGVKIIKCLKTLRCTDSSAVTRPTAIIFVAYTLPSIMKVKVYLMNI